MFTRPTRMLAVIISLIVRPPVPRRGAWMYLRSSIGSSRRRQSAADLLEDREVGHEIRRQEIGCRIFLSRGLLHESVPFQEIQVVPDRAVVDAQDFRELVRVAWPCVQRLDDPRPVRSSPGPRDEEPEQLTKRRAHGRPRAVRRDRLKSVSCLSSPRGSSRRRRSEEHTSELQSPCNLVCRLLLEKKIP